MNRDNECTERGIIKVTRQGLYAGEREKKMVGSPRRGRARRGRLLQSFLNLRRPQRYGGENVIKGKDRVE